MKIFSLWVILFVREIFSDRNQQGYTASIEAVDHCEGFNNTYVSLEHFKMYPNHSSTGYMEIVKDFPMPSTVSVDVFIQENKHWSRLPISVRYLDMCRTLEKDLWFIPTTRTLFTIPERCPIKKGRVKMISPYVHFRMRGIFPSGCLRGQLSTKHKKKMFYCLRAILKFTEYKNLENLISIFVFRKENNDWSRSLISFRDMDLCRTLEKDKWILPAIRPMIRIPQSCPVRKGVVEVKSLTYYRRSNRMYPIGCIKGKFLFKYKNKEFACFQAIMKFASSKDVNVMVCPKL